MNIRAKYFDSQRNSKFVKFNDMNQNQYQSINENNSGGKHRRNQTMNEDFK